MVAVHKEGLRKAGTPVDEIENEGEVGQPGHPGLMDVGLGLWEQLHEQQYPAAEHRADTGDAQRRAP